MNIAIFLSQKLDPYAGGVQSVTSKLSKIFHYKQHHVIIISVANHLTELRDFEGITLYCINKTEENQLKIILEKEAIDCIINQMGFFVSLINLTDFDLLNKGRSNIFYITVFIAKLSLGFGIYQLIQAFRKFK